MIESLVEQIEARFQDAQAAMSDPEVIGDRQRYAEAGRLFNQLSTAARLAEEWRHARSDAEGAEEMLAEGGDDPELRAEMEAARARMEELEEEIRLAMVERDPNDDKDVIVEIRAGAGGDEAGDRLVPARAETYSRLHPRCGTSFLLIVMVLAIFVFAPIGLPEWYWLVLSRILGIPLIAGLSYEVIKWAGKNRRKRWVRALMWPGLMLQNLTTREPDRDQLAVAIAALEAVLDVETPEKAAEEAPIEIVA